MHHRDCAVVVTAELPEAFVELCGVSLLERLLRNLQRLGVRHAHLLSHSASELAPYLERASTARADITLALRPQPAVAPSVRDILSLGETVLIISASAHYDPRLINALLRQSTTAVLLDSDPPSALRPLFAQTAQSANGWTAHAALVERQFLAGADADVAVFPLLHRAAAAGNVAVIDAHKEPTYVASMRRNIRPICFPAPGPEHRALAESFLLDAAQNGTLDLPAKVHAPIETWIVARLCKTAITPNQITLVTAAVSAVVTTLFAMGSLATGTLFALAVGVLDGLDGKQARVKVETTPLGQREHALDYVLELSWWTALAWHFESSGMLENAYGLWALLVGSDLADRAVKKRVKRLTGRNLDDVAPIDRFVRLIGGRRNIYIWMLAVGLMLSRADQAFVALCCWGGLTAAVHALRGIQISRHTTAAPNEGAAH